MGNSLHTALRHHDPSITPAGLLCLEFHEQGDKEMPLVWVTVHTLQYMWSMRTSGRVVDLFLTRSMLENKITLLRETRYENEASLIDEIFNNLM